MTTNVKATLIALVLINIMTPKRIMAQAQSDASDWVAGEIARSFATEIKNTGLTSVRFSTTRFNGQQHPLAAKFNQKLLKKLKEINKSVVSDDSPQIMIKTIFFRDIDDSHKDDIVQVHSQLVLESNMRVIAQKEWNNPISRHLKDPIFVHQYGLDKGNNIPPRTFVSHEITRNDAAIKNVNQMAADHQKNARVTAATGTNLNPHNKLVILRNNLPYYELAIFAMDKNIFEGKKSGNKEWKQLRFEGMATELKGNVLIDENHVYKINVKNLTKFNMAFRLVIDGMGWEEFKDRDFFKDIDKVIMTCEPNQSYEFNGWLKDATTKSPFTTVYPTSPDKDALKGFKDPTSIGKIQIQAVWGCYENEKAILERSHGANFGDSKGRRGDRVSTKKPDFKNDRTIQSQTIADNRPLIWESLDEKDLRVLSWFYLIPETR
ncbi:MAG: hypothetical protein NTZ71_08845 [Planctomycetota bacterium]|nr:hypothetical protein [Planctomycetota bacterium]